MRIENIVFAKTAGGEMVVGEYFAGTVGEPFIKNAWALAYREVGPGQIQSKLLPFMYPVSDAEVNIGMDKVVAHVSAPASLADLYVKTTTGLHVQSSLVTP